MCIRDRISRVRASVIRDQYVDFTVDIRSDSKTNEIFDNSSFLLAGPSSGNISVMIDSKGVIHLSLIHILQEALPPPPKKHPCKPEEISPYMLKKNYGSKKRRSVSSTLETEHILKKMCIRDRGWSMEKMYISGQTT